MKHWLKGKRGGACFLLTVAVLVMGSLGWVTYEAVALENARTQAAQRIEQQRAEAEFDRTVRLAMWWLDSSMQAELNRESLRPYRHFDAGVACRLVPPVQGKGQGPAAAINFMELVPLPDTQPPAWMQQHFLVALDSDWSSPQQLRESIIRGLALASETPKNSKSPREQEQILAQLANSLTAPNLWGHLHNREGSYAQRANLAEGQTQGPPNQLPSQFQPSPPGPGPQNPDTPMRQNPFANSNDRHPSQVDQQGLARQQLNKDTYFRKSRASDQNLNPNESIAENIRRQGGKWIVGIPGQFVPLWLGEEHEEQLVLARSIQIGDKHVSQVTLIDVPQLCEALAGQVRDLFPAAKVVPVKPGGEDAHSERMMFTAPFALDPGEGPKSADVSSSLGWTPLRIGLALGWAAALIALLAVGLGGWSLLNLSERRVAFVSAVTHELRTPLTTLRLYLDMLTNGMVRDEERRAEYLRTLNAESERLNRLVANVLDFSRLENQKPVLEKSAVGVPEFLEQVCAAWQAQCSNMGKQLELDNQLGAEARATLDAKLVQQILGNLIDNACKYSQGASDPRITLRAGRGGAGRIVFEVEDRGPGVPLSERHVIFKPFRRGRNAAAKASGGVGLGLALAQRWARHPRRRPHAGGATPRHRRLLPIGNPSSLITVEDNRRTQRYTCAIRLPIRRPGFPLGYSSSGCGLEGNVHRTAQPGHTPSRPAFRAR